MLRRHMKLNITEKIALDGLLNRDIYIQEKYILPLQHDFKQLITEIEIRFNLPAGSIGTTYELDQSTYEIKENKSKEEEPNSPPI